MTEANDTKPAAKRPRNMAREPNQEAVGVQPLSEQAATVLPNAVKPQSKTALVLDLLRRPTGAGIDELVAATGWLPHTTRAVLTGIKKKGHAVTSEKFDGARRYSIVEPVAGAD